MCVVFDQALQKEAYKLLTERDTGLLKDGFIGKEVTQVLLKSGVKEVGDSEIEFSNGEKLAYGFCVWAAGNGPIPLVVESLEKIEYQKNAQKQARGRFVVDRWLRLTGDSLIIFEYSNIRIFLPSQTLIFLIIPSQPHTLTLFFLKPYLLSFIQGPKFTF